MPKHEQAPLVAAAIAFQKLSAEAFGPQRQRENDDLEFQVAEKQWPEDVRIQRQGQTVQGVPIPARPMLSIPKLDQPIQILFNQWARAHYGVQVHPESQDADNDTAEIIQGLYRSIEVDSRANLGRGWGYDRAIKAGFGNYRVNVVYDDSTDDPDDLKIVIERILRQSSVYLDPFAMQPDFSDQRRCLIVSFISRSDFKREYPDAQMSGMEADELITMQSQMPNWSWTNTSGAKDDNGRYATKSERLKWFDGENDTVCVAEYFYTDWIDQNVGGRRGTRKVPVVMWAKINGIEILDGNDDKSAGRPWNGKYIPIIPCIGKELQPFDAERRWQGLIGPNKDSARLFNYEVSNAVEKDALATKAPWVGAVGQFRTNSVQWAIANVRNLQYLEYDPITVQGNLAPPPKRNLESPDLSSAVALISIANQNIQAGTSLFDESLGKNAEQKSGRAVLAIQQQGDISQSHYLANMADISMTYEAKVVLDIMCGDKQSGRAGVYDRESRRIRVRKEDNTQEEAIINHPYVIDERTKRPVPVPGWAEGMPIPPNAKYYNLKQGQYGTVVSIGKAYQTRMQQGSDALGEVIKSIPETALPLLPTWLDFQDFPGHEVAADIMRKLQPPQLQDQGPDNPEMLKQQLAQGQQIIEALTAQLKHATQLLETESVKQQGQLEITRAKGTTEIRKTFIQETAESERAEKDRQLDLVLAQITALSKELADTKALFAETQARLEAQDHETRLAAADAGQEEAMARTTHAQALEAQAMQPQTAEPEAAV